METLNAVAWTPLLSVFSSSSSKKEPRKPLSIPSIPALRLSLPNSTLSTTFQGSLAFASSIISASGSAKALTYEEALQQSVSSSPSEIGIDFDFDARGFIDNVVGFATENPAIIAGGAVVVALPLVLSRVFGGSKRWGVESARNAYARLADDGTAGLVDIRGTAELRKIGGPDIRGLGKKPVSIAYKGDDKLGFLKKLSSKFKDPGNTTLFILDKFDGNSELVAELVTANGLKAAYAIRDGAEGRRGWMNSNLPWIPPKKAFSLDFGNLADVVGEGAEGSVAIAIAAAAAGLGIVAFSEVETILQVLGSAAIIQILSKKLLFAEVRKWTLQQVEEYLNTKVAPKELVDDLKDIGRALLPTTGSSMALPAPAEAVPPVPVEVNSVPQPEIIAESLPVSPTSLSPFPYYPDLKPPLSPSPSPP